MEPQQLILNIRWHNHVFPLDGLRPNSTISELKCCISHVTDVNLQNLKIYTENPFKEVDVGNDSLKLIDIPLKWGDTLIVEERIDESCPLSPPAAAIPPASISSLQIREPQMVGILPEGVLLRYAMPTNNSCLFASVYFAVSEDKTPLPNYSYLREVIADAVAADPETYNEAFLGQPNEEYCNWILQEEHWGGAIELSILCKHFEVEIVTIDVQSSRLHHFGENFNFDHRIFLIYNGVHYDALALKPSDPSRPLETVFPVTNEVILQKAKELLFENCLGQRPHPAESRRSNFVCSTCNQSFCCQAELADHVLKTKHRSYSMISLWKMAHTGEQRTKVSYPGININSDTTTVYKGDNAIEME